MFFYLFVSADVHQHVHVANVSHKSLNVGILATYEKEVAEGTLCFNERQAAIITKLQGLEFSVAGYEPTHSEGWFQKVT